MLIKHYQKNLTLTQLYSYFYLRWGVLCSIVGRHLYCCCYLLLRLCVFSRCLVLICCRYTNCFSSSFLITTTLTPYWLYGKHFIRVTFTGNLRAQVEHNRSVSNVLLQLINLFQTSKLFEPLNHLTEIIQSQPSPQIDLEINAVN